jgi:tetratricopeptide (TPR) repeat protein
MAEGEQGNVAQHACGSDLSYEVLDDMRFIALTEGRYATALEISNFILERTTMPSQKAGTYLSKMLIYIHLGQKEEADEYVKKAGEVDREYTQKSLGRALKFLNATTNSMVDSSFVDELFND